MRARHAASADPAGAIEAQIQAIATMRLDQLRAEWIKHFDEPLIVPIKMNTCGETRFTVAGSE